MKNTKLKLAALLFVCAAFVSAGALTSVKADDGDSHNGSFCQQYPTAVQCQPTPCVGAECPPLPDGGRAAASPSPEDESGDSLLDSWLKYFGLK